MQISIVSGKGGAGKTTLAVGLFTARPGSTLADCDVEEPNAGLFLDIVWNAVETVRVGVPVINEKLCTHCGACARFCAFGAFLSAPTVTIPLPERCHDCGGCAMVCPAGAITYGSRPVGRIGQGSAGRGRFVFGELDIGEYSGVRIIRRVREIAGNEETVWIDGPPGTSCSAAAATEGCGYAVIVGEPTPFGVSDMAMAVEMLRKMGVPFGVIVNRDGIGDGEIDDYCRKEGLEVLGRIPFDRSVAEAMALGRAGRKALDMRVFAPLAEAILKAASTAARVLS
jgi:MinD superfamily P-loop ATPase